VERQAWRKVSFCDGDSVGSGVGKEFTVFRPSLSLGKFEETEIEWVELVAELERSMLRDRIILGYASINSEKPMFAGVEFVTKQGRSMPAPLRGR
jgi:hypothetical protein